MVSGLSQMLPVSRRSAKKSGIAKKTLDHVDSATAVRPAGAPLPRAQRFQYPEKESTEESKAVEAQSQLYHVTTASSLSSVKLPKLPKSTSVQFGWFDIAIAAFSIVLYLSDIGLDCFVAYKHSLTLNEYPLYFGFTVAFIILSTLVTSIFSLWWYYFEYKVKLKLSKEQKRTDDNSQKEVSRGLMLLRVVGSICMCGPIMRNIDTIRYGVLSKNQAINKERRDYYFSEMKYERVDGAMLRLFEAFLEAGPQILLQIFITLHKGIDGEKEKNYFLVVITMISILVSMLSLAYSIVAYHKELRLSRDDRENLKISGLIIRFIWRLFEVNPRIVAMAMFMSAYTYFLGVFMGIHFIMMVIWIWRLKTEFCETKSCEPMFVFVMGLIWSFCFLNIKDGRTRKRALLFYTLFWTENIILVVLWSIHSKAQLSWYRNIPIAVVIGSMVPMVGCMLIYYRCLHPVHIPTCLSAEFWCSSHDKDKSANQPNTRYNNGDGDKGERQVLADLGIDKTRSVTGDEENDEPEKDTAVDHELSDHQAADNNSKPIETNGNAESPGSLSSRRSSDLKGGDKPNLDNCVEIDGYLETFNLPSSAASKLHRQDTMPGYEAPTIPSSQSNYGATVPGGAPCAFTNYSTQNPIQLDRKRGSTLPGNSVSTAAVVNSPDGFVPFVSDEEDSPSLPPRVSIRKRDSHRHPVPEPRISVFNSPTKTESFSPRLIEPGSLSADSLGVPDPDENSYLTLITDMSGSPSFLRQTLSPSVLEESTMACDTLTNTPDPRHQTISDSSAVDTPLKGQYRSVNLSELGSSPDTPVRDSHIPP